MKQCEMLKAGRTEEEYFLGLKQLFCPEAKNCLYKNGIVGEIGEWGYSICKTHGQIEQTEKIDLENLSVSEEIFTQQQSQLSA